MKINKIMLTLFILLAILTATAVSATEDVENMTAESPLEEIESSDVDTVLKTDEKEQLEEKTDFNYNKDEILGEASEDVIANESSTDFALDVKFPKTVYGDSSNYFEAYIPEDAGGALKLYINGSEAGVWNVFDYYGDYNSFKIYVENPNPTNAWKVIYEDDSRYPVTSEEGTFEFKWVDIPEERGLSDKFYIDLEGLEGVLIFLIDGKQVFNDFFNGEAYVSYENLSVGNHNYEIILYDNSNKLVFDETGTFKADYSFTPSMREEYPLVDKIEIPIKLPDDATGNVCVSYNGADFTAEITDGWAYVTLENLELGKKEIIFTYMGDDKYPQKTVRENISIEGYAIVPYENPGNYYISLTLPSDAKGKLNISLLNEDGSIKEFLASIDLVDGTAQYILPPGYHYIRAEYNGTDYDVAPLEHYEFYVLPYIKVPDFVILGENITIELFASNASNKFKIIIGNEYSVENFNLDDNGRATINVTFEDYQYWTTSVLKNPHRITVFYNNTQLTNFVVNFNILPGTFTYPIEFSFDKSANMTVKLSEYAKGNISVYAMDSEYQEYVFAQNVSVSGNAIVPLFAEKPGDYGITIRYVDEKFGEYTTMTGVHVPNADAGSDVAIPQTVTSDTLEINLPEDATGSILAIIDGKSKIYDLMDGSAMIDLSAIPAGPHNLTIKYKGDENYEGFEKTAVFTVKYTSSVSIEPVTNVTYGEPVVVKYSIENRTNDVSVVVYLDDLEITSDYTLTDDNVTIVGLAAGEYRIVIRNNEDDSYAHSEASAFFNVSKASSSVTIEPVANVTYGVPVVVKYSVVNRTSQVSVTVSQVGGAVVDNLNYTLTDDAVTIYDLAAGNYHIFIWNNADANYDTSADNAYFTVKSTSSVTIYPVTNVTYGEPVVVKYLIVNRTSQVSVTVSQVGGAVVDNLNYTLADDAVTIYDLAAGNYHIFIWNNADANYDTSADNAYFNVSKASSGVTIYPVTNVTYGNRVDIGYAIENRSSNVTFSIRHADSDLQPEVTGINVAFNATAILINGLTAGKYVIYVSDNGDENHTGDTAHAFFNVTKANPNLKVTSKVNEYGIISIEAVFDSKATGNVTFVVMNESGDVVAKNTEDIVNGVATFAEIAKHAKGRYYCVVTYNGDSNYGSWVIDDLAPVVISKDYISPKTTQLDVEGGEVNVTVDLGVNANGTVHVVYPSGYVDNVTIKDGKVNFYNVFMNETGPLSFVLDYDGDGNYYGFYEYFVDFTIKKATFVTAKPISVVYKNNAKWTINLKDADNKAVAGQTIKVTVNGKTYTGKTDANGNAVVTIAANFVPKAYTAKIVFAGTALLEDDFENVKFTVKKATPKLTAKKKTFKAKTKVKKYTIVLKDHKKKAMKKVKVYIKVKGKTYKATTNKKGKATFKIKNLKKKGTYKAKVTFKATKYFNKVTKTVKIKVKK